MATTFSELSLRRDYESALQRGDTITAGLIRNEFVQRFSISPEQSLANSEGVALESAIAARNLTQALTFVDSPTFNPGSNIADITGRGTLGGIVTTPPAGASIGGGINSSIGTQRGDVAGGGNITLPPIPPVPPPPPVIINNEPTCDYRYSFGCPEFSKRLGDAGCRILLPVYRTCYPSGGTRSFGIDPNNLSSFSYTQELLGYIDISVYVDEFNETDTNAVENGLVGTRRTRGTRITTERLRQAIIEQASVGLKSAPRFIKQTATNGETVIVQDTSKNGSIDLVAVVSNLQDPTVSVAPGQLQPKGDINRVADYWARTCNLGKQPDYCVTERTFTPRPPAEPPGPRGPFVGLDPVLIPGTRKISGTRRLYDIPIDEVLRTTPFQKHPSKPCRLAKPATFVEVQDVTDDFGIPVYADESRTLIISYQSIESVATVITGERGVEYVGEQIDPNCEFRLEEKELAPEDVFGDPCLGVIKKDVYKVYADGRRELYLQGVFVRYFRKQDADCSPETVKVYHPLDLGKDVMTAKIRARTKGLFDGAQTLECHHTSSTQPTSSKNHYYEVTDCDSCGKTPYFAVAYGHNAGSGSVWSDGELNDTPTRAIYSQYRLMALDMPQTEFTFYTNGVATSSKDVYVINFSRTGMSDRVDPGNWEIALAELNGGAYANNVFTGSNVEVSSSSKILTFIDDSDDRSDSISCTHDPYVSYDIVSGSLNGGLFVTNNKHTYGVVYPNLGVIVLDPYKLNTELGFNTVTGSNIAGDNAFKLFTSISGSGTLGSYMKARNVQYKTTNHYFVRVSAPLANYSNNPTYVGGGSGEFLHACYDKNPQTYITSIGLYDDFNQLLAIAKLSRPINKSFDNDVLIKIRLNW
jgi:hypothetical protein